MSTFRKLATILTLGVAISCNTKQNSPQPTPENFSVKVNHIHGIISDKGFPTLDIEPSFTYKIEGPNTFYTVECFIDGDRVFAGNKIWPDKEYSFECPDKSIGAHTFHIRAENNDNHIFVEKKDTLYVKGKRITTFNVGYSDKDGYTAFSDKEIILPQGSRNLVVKYEPATTPASISLTAAGPIDIINPEKDNLKGEYTTVFSATGTGSAVLTATIINGDEKYTASQKFSFTGEILSPALSFDVSVADIKANESPVLTFSNYSLSNYAGERVFTADITVDGTLSRQSTIKEDNGKLSPVSIDGIEWTKGEHTVSVKLSTADGLVTHTAQASFSVTSVALTDIIVPDEIILRESAAVVNVSPVPSDAPIASLTLRADGDCFEVLPDNSLKATSAIPAESTLTITAVDEYGTEITKTVPVYVQKDLQLEISLYYTGSMMMNAYYVTPAGRIEVLEGLSADIRYEIKDIGVAYVMNPDPQDPYIPITLTRTIYRNCKASESVKFPASFADGNIKYFEEIAQQKEIGHRYEYIGGEYRLVEVPTNYNPFFNRLDMSISLKFADGICAKAINLLPVTVLESRTYQFEHSIFTSIE